MSLLDGRHSLKVRVAVKGETDRYGQAAISYSEPMTVAGNVQFLSSTEIADLGLQTDTVCRVLAKDWPGGPYSLIEWEGRWFEQKGEPLRFDRSSATSHFEVIMVPRTTPIK